MKFTKTDARTFLIVIVAIIVAGLVLNYGDDLPIIEDAHNGYGG